MCAATSVVTCGFVQTLNGDSGMPPYLGLRSVGVWATILKPDGPYIGRCELYSHVLPGGEMAPGEASLSFYIARKFWRRGFASEAAAAFVQFGCPKSAIISC
jgi:RimJ/RimL family protein N-acetyltransferase